MIIVGVKNKTWYNDAFTDREDKLIGYKAKIYGAP